MATANDPAPARGSIDPDWFRSFFTGIALDFWRQAMPPGATRAEVDFLVRALQLAPGARVLAVATPASRHATFQVGDMRDLGRQGVFDRAFALGNSFGYVDPAGTRAYLAGVARSLRPGARFVFDSGYIAESLLTHLTEHERHELGEFVFLEQNRYLFEQGCVETSYTFARGAERVTRKGWQWVFTLREVRAALADAGFVVEQQLADPAGTPYHFGAPCLLLVARRY
ncbi:MAG: class I SAM-dependent methyltransferase [Planctomycetes bacterium]|nr:class I SAM-dependent methyltransferase [Planctomycetota bacterium]